MESAHLLAAKKYFFVYCLLLALVAGTSYLIVWGTQNEREAALGRADEDPIAPSGKELPDSN